MGLGQITESRRAPPALERTAVALAMVSLSVITIVGLAPLDLTYVPWSGNPADVRGLCRWLLAAWTEPEFYTSALAGAGLLMGALTGEYLARAGSRSRGLGLACGSDMWSWAVTSSIVGLLLSNLLWGWTLSVTGDWQPTFVPVVSIAPTVVLVYGRGWRPMLTGAVLSALIVVPLSIAATHYLCRPIGQPLVVGVTGGMAVGACISFAVCRWLPWLKPPAAESTAEQLQPKRTLIWSARRVLADFSEAQFFGNEWASAGLILGAVAAAIMSPAVPVYGSGSLKAVLAAQVVAAAAGMAIWHRQWAMRPFYPTFVPIVSVAPAAVLALDGSAVSIIGGGLLGALVGPPLAAAISACLPKDFHPFIGNVASMAISTAAIIPTLRLLQAAL